MTIADDARWIADLFASGRTLGDPVAGLLPTVLVGFSSRIVYEGTRTLRSNAEGKRIQALVDLLPTDGSPILEAARHATKLTDGIRPPAQPLERQLDALLRVHRKYMFGRTPWPLRRLLPELAVQTLQDRILSVSVSAQFDFGVPAAVPPPDIGPVLYDVMVSQGAALAVLTHADLSAVGRSDPGEPSGLLDLHAFEDWRIDDWRSSTLSSRYTPCPSDAGALILGLLEGRVNTALHVLAPTEQAYPGPVFRARYLTAIDALRTIRVLATDPATPVRIPDGLRVLANSGDATRLVEAPESIRLRNVLAHYGFRNDLVLETTEPLLGLVDRIDHATGYDQLDRTVRDLLEELSDQIIAT